MAAGNLAVMKPVPVFATTLAMASATMLQLGLPLDAALDEFTRVYVTAALVLSNGSRPNAAKRLGVPTKAIVKRKR
jgi:DNA-binding NtrC family response regulator